jgi:hypothetical protein
MNTKSSGQNPGTTPKNPAELALELYTLLAPHPADTRVKAMHAAMTLLDDELPQSKATNRSGGGDTSGSAGEFADLNLGPRAQKWVQRHGVTRGMLDEIFHITSEGVEVTASAVPGTSKREMTLNCYLLEGLRGLLRSDQPLLNEQDAIATCKRLTAYDKNNHTTHRSAIGNKMSGTKPNFTLTGPGEIAAAELVKQMAGSR